MAWQEWFIPESSVCAECVADGRCWSRPERRGLFGLIKYGRVGSSPGKSGGAYQCRSICVAASSSLSLLVESCLVQAGGVGLVNGLRFIVRYDRSRSVRAGEAELVDAAFTVLSTGPVCQVRNGSVR